MTPLAGVPNFGCTSPSFAKKSPSRDMAWMTRADVSRMPWRALMMDTSTGIAISRALTGPNTAPTDSEAAAVDDASRTGPSAAR